jgi:hypothetical protein
VSPGTTPGNEVFSTVAARVPSYCLLFAVNDPVSSFLLTFAVAVHGPAASE